MHLSEIIGQIQAINKIYHSQILQQSNTYNQTPTLKLNLALLSKIY